MIIRLLLIVLRYLRDMPPHYILAYSLFVAEKYLMIFRLILWFLANIL